MVWLNSIPGWDLLAKLDGDLQLTEGVVQQVEQRMLADPSLGITGPYLSVLDAHGRLRRERCPRHHVRGATKFYRRECWAQIAPLAPILGWDTIDEIGARLHGWRTESSAPPEATRCTCAPQVPSMGAWSPTAAGARARTRSETIPCGWL